MKAHPAGVAGHDEAIAPDATREPSTRWVLASLCLSMLMPSLDTSIANAGLPTLAGAFAAPFHAVQWIVIAYLLAITTLIVGVGRLGDIVGRRRLLIAGIALFTGASLLCGIAPTLWLLVGARAVQGIGAAIMMVLTMAVVGEAVPKARLGGAMGLLGTMSAIGTTLGPSLGCLLIAAIGWRSIFLVNVPLGLITVLLARKHLPRDRPASAASRARFDGVGTMLLALALLAFTLAVTTGHGSFGSVNMALLCMAALGCGLFVLVEAKVASPMIRLAMLRDRVLGSGLAMGALVATVVMATLVVGPFYLSRALGLDVTHVGLVASIGPLAAALAGLPAGRAVDRFGAQRAILAGLGAMAAGTFALSSMPGSFGIAGYILPIIIVTSGYALFQASNNTAVMADVDPDQRGIVSGMLSLSRNLGLITGASVMGAVFAHASRTADMACASPVAVAVGMRATFAVAAMLVLIALAVALSSQRRPRRNRANRPG